MRNFEKREKRKQEYNEKKKHEKMNKLMRGKYIKCISSKCDGSGGAGSWGTHLRTVDIIVFQIAEAVHLI